MMIPNDTDVACPCCETEFTLRRDMYEGDTITCENCDAKLIMEDGDLEEVDDDIYDDDEEDDVEENPAYPIATSTEGAKKVK